jgi:hypothetical protein
MIRHFETVVDVGTDHTAVLTLPDSVPPGPCRVSIEIQATRPKPNTGAFTEGWPVHNVGLADPNYTFRREDLYGDDGR